ncbi:hypothetical protein C461_03178 [Halorubrum aidingense JCM 13560]|uniref:Uncharacterized protein n=1 Tax=Halorubrum aidingense JCM 13560 TaxID=1230454 RepID=M0PKP6_9EURY|nr:hypothetical protein [Halorubrum aidingense]EMA69330.1 hypothetical protein C461_03178 [Halorubrum aidingense JCM 13560]
MPYSDGDLLAEIRRVADVVDAEDGPTLQQFKDHGEIAHTTVTRRFGSWNDAVERAGFDSRPPEPEIPAADLLDELHRLSDELGERPTVTTMNEHGEYWASTYKRRFGTWNDGLEAAGFEPTPPRTEERITDDELLAELKRLAGSDGRPPTFQQMSEEGAYAARTYVNRFGSWNAAIDAAFNDVA